MSLHDRAIALAESLERGARVADECGASILDSPDDYEPDDPTDLGMGLLDQAKNYNDAAKMIRELESTLAGGGEAVAWCHPEFPKTIAERGDVDLFAMYATQCKPHLIPLFPHPAGAVQVTDEMVERAYASWPNGTSLLRDNLRAALIAALNPGGSRE